MKSNKVISILNSSFILPMLLKSFKKRDERLIEFLGLSEREYKELRKLQNLLKYNYYFVYDQESVNYNYQFLRKGLGEYFQLYLRNIFQELGEVGRKIRFLDYGAGNGEYSKQFKKDNPSSRVEQLDRETGLKIDFEKTPNWYLKYLNRYDIVLISELLHCKSRRWQKYIIKSVYKILKVGGRVIVNENQDIFMGYRLSIISGGKELAEVDIMSLMKQFSLLKKVQFKNHTAYLYEKI